MTYWNMNQIEVEDIMTEFLKKALATSEFDPTLNAYVYSIHDLQLDYLKGQLKRQEGNERQLHREFLKKYLEKADHEFGAIVDDSYIFSNFGYHVFKAEQFDLFAKVSVLINSIRFKLNARIQLQCTPLNVATSGPGQSGHYKRLAILSKVFL